MDDVTMSDNLVEQLTENHKEILEEFRSRLKDKLKPPFDDRYLWRFLKARNFNIERSEKMIREHFKLWDKLHADSILDTYLMPKGFHYFPYHPLGFDSNGNIVVGFVCGRVDVRGVVNATTSYDRLIYGLHLMESLTGEIRKESLRTGKYGGKIITVDDLSGLSIRALFDRSVIRAFMEFMSFYQNNYPEVLHCAYLLNAPTAFLTFFNFIKRFVDPVTISKVQMIPPNGCLDEMLRDIDPSILPVTHGGTLRDPNGNGQCHSKLPINIQVPLCLYLKEGDLNLDPDMEKVVLRERTYYNHKVLVSQKNSWLCWLFQTKDYNISFGIYYVPEDVTPMPQTSLPKLSKSFRHRIRRGSKDGHDIVLPLERVNSHNIPERGEILCEKVGLYLVHFDNTFSWMTPKELHYKVHVNPPNNEDDDDDDDDDD